MKRVLLFVLIGLVALVLLGGGCLISGYNRAVTLDEAVSGQWAQVENQLQRRFDLIPNLVETVKGYAEHEKEVFISLADARKSYFQANTIQGKARAAGMFESSLSRLLLLQERYPDLKANESFLKLQDQLEGTENRLSVERGRYNDAVRALNTFRRRFAGRLYAALAGVEAAEYFEVAPAAKETPKVDFSPSTGQAP